MLVFTRKVGESLMIADNIEVKLLSIDRDQIRVGITAPREIPIHRKEVHDSIVRQNYLASQSALPSAALRARLKKPQ